MNWPLFSVIYSIAATVTVGVLMIAALVTGFNQIPHIQMAVAAGIIVSIPAALFFTKKVGSITGKEGHKAYGYKSTTLRLSYFKSWLFQKLAVSKASHHKN